VQAAILCTGRFSGRLPARRLIAVVAVGATAVAATALLGPVVAPSRQPADVRTVTEPPATPHDGVSPLQQYLAYRDGKIPLRLALRSSTPVERVRMATLTRFNGEYWTTGGDFRRAGTRLPPPRIGAPHGISQQVRVERGNLDWLITAGRPERVSVGGLEVDRATGDAMTPALPGNRPLTSYTATAVSNEPAADDLSQDRPVFVGDHLARSLPGRIQTFVEKTVGEERTPAEQLFALRNAFTDRFRYDLSKTAPGGHGYYQIGQLLDTRRGTSEQYASAFAVMAESLGMDARVVMGFLTRDGTVQGADVDAWVEVRYARLGWVPIYPSPSRTSALRTPNTVNSTPQNPPDAFGKLARNHEDEAAASGSGAAQPGPPVHKGASPVGMILGVLVSTALACVLGMAPCLRLLRRLRRRRAPCARQAVLGAWWETADRLREAGYPVVASTTTGDTVRLLPDIDSVRRLARLIDAAAYAPEAPPPGMLRDAWAVAAEIRRDLRSRTPLRRRAQAILDPRPLLSVPRRRGDDGAAKWPGRQRRPLPPGGGAPGPQRAH
jgi:transglutaminase-like putative cysteine protease